MTDKAPAPTQAQAQAQAPTDPASVGAVAPPVDPTRDGSLTARIIYVCAIAFSAYQIWFAAFTPLPSLVARSIHVGFLLLIAFLTLRATSAGNDRHTPWYDWLFAMTGFALGFYHLALADEIILRYEPTTLDTIVGAITIALVFEGARRAMGIGLAVVCGAFLLWGFFGHLLPPPFNHRGFDGGQILMQMYLGTEGIYGTPIFVSATYLFLFVLFGTFLQQAGMVGLFNDIAMGTVGHTKGGPAKVAVVSSAIMGTISGSGIANVVTTGMFTIPLMKRFGYKPAFAGAVEATASMGGQIMPPVMGAVAFIMAETVGVPYLEVVKAATIPAILYFAAVLWMVHLEAGRGRLRGLPKEDCPSPWAAVRRNWYLMLPLVILVYLLFTGYTPLFAGTIGLLMTVVLILGASAAAQVGPVAVKALVWIFVGIASSAFFTLGPMAVFGVIAALVAVLAFRHGGRETIRLCLDSMAEGARNAVGVGLACAVVGVIIAVLTLTGLAVTVGGAIVDIGRASLFLSLLLTMLTCIVLGMGIPSIPNYIITSSIAGPILAELGVPIVVAHMFVFYFGIMANLTPPVALAAFAAAPIARAGAMEISLWSLRIAIAGFVLPFMAVYAPALMMQGESWFAVVYITIKAVIAIGLWGAATIGYLAARMTWPERLWATAAAFSLVVAKPVTDEVGLALAVTLVGWHLWRTRRAARKAGTA
ncbi:TRAP transporter permease [Novispirillum sp. DQ9]|uniref:TRAP transporter permease n=1 Tax=Novispirillum sp. DQ9 TaxID=3398612 RepID=UPI003C7DC870